MGKTSIVMSFLYSSGVVISLFLAVVTFKIKKHNRLANIIMPLFIFAWVYICLICFLYNTGLYSYFPFIVMTKEPIKLSFGPLIFLYVLALTNSEFSFTKRDLLHFLPFFLASIFLIPFYIIKHDSIHTIILDYSHFRSNLSYYLLGIKLIQDSIYAYFCIKNLKIHSGKIKESLSFIEKVNYSWIRNLLIGYLIFIFSYILLMVMFSIYLPDARYEVENIINILFFVFICYFGYRSLLQIDISGNIQSLNIDDKYNKSKLALNKAYEYKDKLLDYIDHSKIYLDDELTLSKLSKKVSISSHYISQVLNQTLNMNFYEFINQYRIKEAIRSFSDPDRVDRTILDILIESGFKSKSVFNTAFKEYTGMTPSEYRKKNSF